jgi:CheY-like chemotaxis protein
MTTSRSRGFLPCRPILVIEDSDDDFKVLERSFRAAHVELVLERLTTGRQIAEYLQSVSNMPSARYPLLILLDLNLPGADGKEVLQEVRCHPELCTVPVVIVTSSTQPVDIETCYKRGASGYLVKPLELERFESMIQNLADYWLRCVELPPRRQ